MSEDKGKIKRGSLLSEPYPDDSQWKELLSQFSPEAIAHKLLLAQIPYVFKDEPLKFALFRHTIAEAFDVEPSNVFIVGSAMAGRSLKGDAISKIYTPGGDSDIDTLIVSETLFTSYVMHSLEWVRDATKPSHEGNKPLPPSLEADTIIAIERLARNTAKGIWRPDSLPNDAAARQDFFRRFNHVSLKTLGLQLSEDTVAKVNGRIARSFSDAVSNLSQSIYKLGIELKVFKKGPTKVADEPTD